jgi:hypothetical protein
MGGMEHKTWATTMLWTVEQLRKESSEVSKFLGQ